MTDVQIDLTPEELHRQARLDDMVGRIIRLEGYEGSDPDTFDLDMLVQRAGKVLDAVDRQVSYKLKGPEPVSVVIPAPTKYKDAWEALREEFKARSEGVLLRPSHILSIMSEVRCKSFKKAESRDV